MLPTCSISLLCIHKRAAAVIGVPSEHWGEEVVAFVKPEPSVMILESDIVKKCEKLIGSVKTPKKIILVHDLPETALGKINKKYLRNTYNNNRI